VSGADAAAPVPFPTPPPAERAIQDYLDVIHEVRELRVDVNAVAELQAKQSSAMATLAADVARLADGRTVDTLTLARVERKLNAIMKAMGVVDAG
jgi:hypothetical protein